MRSRYHWLLIYDLKRTTKINGNRSRLRGVPIQTLLGLCMNSLLAQPVGLTATREDFFLVAVSFFQNCAIHPFLNRYLFH